MLKQVIHLSLIVALVTVGVWIGYRQGVTTGHRALLPTEYQITVPGVTVELPHEKLVLAQWPAVRSIKLDDNSRIGLFGSPLLPGEAGPIGPVRIDYGIPIARGEALGRAQGFISHIELMLLMFSHPLSCSSTPRTLF